MQVRREQNVRRRMLREIVQEAQTLADEASIRPVFRSRKRLMLQTPSVPTTAETGVVPRANATGGAAAVRQQHLARVPATLAAASRLAPLDEHRSEIIVGVDQLHGWIPRQKRRPSISCCPSM